MTIESLRSFCALIETKSFRKAAETVHRSQPAISQQIKVLETKTGQCLIDRKTHEPTPAGALLYERGRAILNEWAAMVRDVVAFDTGIEQTLHVGTSDTNALYFLPPLVKAFAREMPGVRVEVHSRSSQSVVEDVRRGGLEVGIVTLDGDERGLEVRALFEQRLVLALPARHRLAARPRIDLNDLTSEPFVLLSEETRTGAALRKCFSDNSIEPQIVLDSGSFEVLKRYVSEGVGLSILPEMASKRAPGMKTRYIDALPVIRIGAVWSKGSRLTAGGRLLLDIIDNASRRAP